MTQISSKSTFFYKKLFPVPWFGFLTIFVVTTLLGGAVEKDFMFLVGPCTMAVFGFVLFRKLIWDLADEAYDGGDFLVVRFSSEEENVPLWNIMNVSASTNMNPPRITLRLVQPGKFGSELAFSPTMSFTLNPFAKSGVAEDLIVRVDKARSRRAA
jgi:hypothetical protein